MPLPPRLTRSATYTRWAASIQLWLLISICGPLTLLAMLAPTAVRATTVVQERNGLVVLEAEHVSAQINRGGAEWIAESALAGASNGSYLTAVPNSGVVITSGIPTTSPELQYRIQFSHTGTYYLWARMQNDDATSNSIHIGLDGVLVPSADNLSDETTFHAWNWSQHTMTDQPAKLVIATAGEHTLNVWMREDGVHLDRLLLTSDARMIPSSNGPSETGSAQPLATSFSARINFQPAGAPVPNNYLADTGAAYGDRGNGLTYGWNSAIQSLTRDRNAAASPDQRYDTLIHMQKPEAPNARWELAVPNGTYRVRIVAGDPAISDMHIAIQAEDTLVLQGIPTDSQHWIDGTAVVDVGDGKLSLSSAPGSSNNKINFVEVTNSMIGDTSTPTPAVTNPPLLGVLYNSAIPTDVLERWTGRKNAVAVWFVNWDSAQLDHTFNDVLPLLWNNGNVPMVTWGPSFSNGTPANIDVLVARGDYDSYLNTWSDRLRNWLSGPDGLYGTRDDRRVYIRLGHEMNGNWYPWSAADGANTTADYISMWRHVVSLFRAKGLDGTHIQWIWCATGEDVGGYMAEQYYPGDAYVDWVGVDSYNFGASASWSHWQSPAQAFDPMLGRLRALTPKPVAVPEVGTTTSGGSVAAKSQWITDLYSYVRNQHIGMIAYFNTDKETDWALFGGGNGDASYVDQGRTYKVYNAYKQAIQTLIGADPANPRLITDVQFAGQ